MVSTNLIYVVDDQADYRFILKQLFERYFPVYPIRFFDDGQRLLEALTELRPKPSLILLDRHMPHLDGHQTLVILKQHSAYKKIPVVLMSAQASVVEINDCYEAGANSFLMKKLDLYAMKEMIQTVCHYWLETNQQPIEG